MSEQSAVSGQRTETDPGFLSRLRDRLEGPHTYGQSREFWFGFGVVVLLAVLYPAVRSSYMVSNTAYLLLSTFLGLSLCIVWGYTGIFSFGQVAFYGLAGYTFGIVGINLSGTVGVVGGILAAVVVASLFALALGYFMFYGGVSDVYVGIVTLVTTLVLNTFMGQTAGESWAIGSARLGGFNGMTNIPSIALGPIVFTDVLFYYLVLFLLLFVYLGLRVLVNSNFGYVMVSIREDIDRTETFGYNTRFVQLLVFTLGGALASLSGVLYASWGGYISPSVFGLTFAAYPIIWVATGGRKSLVGAILGTYAISYVSQQLSITSGQYALFILGALLLVAILGLPEGVIPRIAQFVDSRDLVARVPSLGGEQ